MKEYIEREAALYFHFSIIIPHDGRTQVRDAVNNTAKAIAAHIEAIPAADVAEVRHGQWKSRKHWSRCVCSVCSYESENEYNYCPNCGAKMDGGVNDA